MINIFLLKITVLSKKLDLPKNGTFEFIFYNFLKIVWKFQKPNLYFYSIKDRFTSDK